MAVSGGESPYPSARVTRDDVHELHLRLLAHTSPPPLPRLREGGWSAACLLSPAPTPPLTVSCSSLITLSALQIICRSCSRNKYPLRYLNDRVAKVCDRCYAELRKRGTVPSQNSPPLPCGTLCHNYILFYTSTLFCSEHSHNTHLCSSVQNTATVHIFAFLFRTQPQYTSMLFCSEHSHNTHLCFSVQNTTTVHIYALLFRTQPQYISVLFCSEHSHNTHLCSSVQNTPTIQIYALLFLFLQAGLSL